MCNENKKYTKKNGSECSEFQTWFRHGSDGQTNRSRPSVLGWFPKGEHPVSAHVF